ncbi:MULTISPECIES: hypothetical protein [Streptomyces]|uniref:hypothetical protein n=1 Tax=Streptomyces TaxID=1883 RepID=UPI001E54340F|nr:MULTISPECIES: hypothetical protein [Streptomyces]MCZ4102139.1 hypothetical protein [Streptomyces sp. H39-C1]
MVHGGAENLIAAGPPVNPDCCDANDFCCVFDRVTGLDKIKDLLTQHVGEHLGGLASSALAGCRVVRFQAVVTAASESPQLEGAYAS